MKDSCPQVYWDIIDILHCVCLRHTMSWFDTFTYSSPLLSKVWLSLVSVTWDQLRSQNIQWGIPEINYLSVLNYMPFWVVDEMPFCCMSHPGCELSLSPAYPTG